MVRSPLAMYQLALFFVLAFAITWPLHIAAYTYAHNRGLLLSNDGNVLSIGLLLTGDLEPGYAPYLLPFLLSAGRTHCRRNAASLARLGLRLLLPCGVTWHHQRTARLRGRPRLAA